MVSVELKDQVQVVEPAPEELNPTALQEVEDIVGESEKTGTSRQTESGHWFYRMPFAGVRYYTY